MQGVGGSAAPATQTCPACWYDTTPQGSADEQVCPIRISSPMLVPLKGETCMQHPHPLVEQTRLPKIAVRGKNNEPQIDVYANAYVVGYQPELMNNRWAHPLYYLSCIAQRGQGTTLQGLFARLVSPHSRGATLQGVGEVMLAHRQSRLDTCGYTIHCNF